MAISWSVGNIVALIKVDRVEWSIGNIVMLTDQNFVPPDPPDSGRRRQALPGSF